MGTLLTILGCILFAYLSIAFGYKIAMIRWMPDKLLSNLEDVNKLNQEIIQLNKDLSDGVKKMDETNKQTVQYYMTQIHMLGQYMREKHQDNYVFDNMNNGQGFKQEPEKKEFELNDILDKARESGLDSLTKDEKQFLKDQGKND